ncbi:MAG: PepSY-associated TM helix domain-containing protein [Bryobacteraceae bacterium]|jgi:uncharacterized iron-regulated membrane protein
MEFFRQYVNRPQRLWLRRFNFQLHLWAGIILSVYLIVIGATGSILVFREELETLTGVNPWHNVRAQEPLADIVTVIGNMRAAHPQARIVSVFTPTQAEPIFAVSVRGRSLEPLNLAADPSTGQELGAIPRNRSWLSVVRTLHETLLVGPKGRRINGGGAVFLMLLNVTGMVIWWPGLRTWTRALLVDFARTWRRVNFDLHRAVGFWTIALVSFWAISGIYFGWPRETFAFVDRISPVITAKPPSVTVEPQRGLPEPDLRQMIAQARVLDPGTTLKGVSFPANRRAPLLVFMQRANTVGFDYTDTLFFDPYTGQYLSTWKYGVNQSLGDWIIWSQIPLHFGTYWGLGVKIIWAILGLSIPLLTVTGALMYWNRYLRKKWKHLRAPRVAAAPAAAS